MLKTIGSPKEPASNRNDSSRPTFEKNNGNDEFDEFGDDSVKQVRKSGKSKKLAKSRKLSKLGKPKGKKSKKLPKSGNSPNFNAKDSGPNFLTTKARSAFNRLRLAFIEALILRHFDPECHIWIITDALSYAINGMLSQLASGTSPDRVVTKADLDLWHPVAFFFRKIIPTKTQYKTNNGKLLAIIEKFKT